MLTTRVTLLTNLGRQSAAPSIKSALTPGKPSFGRGISIESGTYRPLQGTRIVQWMQPTVKTRPWVPLGGKACQFTSRQMLMAGSAVAGLGYLCYKGAPSLGVEAGPAVWAPNVKDRVGTTYAYLGGSLVFIAAAVGAVARCPTVRLVLSRAGWLAAFGSLAAMWRTGLVCMRKPYQEGMNAKQLAWAKHNAFIGLVIPTLAIMWTPLIVSAAWYAGGMIFGLSVLAQFAPSEKYLTAGAPYAMGLGVLFAESFRGAFVPGLSSAGFLRSNLCAGLLYGGLVLFGLCLVQHSRKVAGRAEKQPAYDPINNSVRIYLDTLNFPHTSAMILKKDYNLW